MEIVPAIDIIGGKCVRLTEGDYSRKSEYGDPLDMALRFVDHGMRRLHLVDLDGAREGRVINYRILEQIAVKTDLVISAGGGIKSHNDLHIVFNSGAKMATGGSIAVKDPELFVSWLEEYGADRIILGSDFKDGNIAVSGWKEETTLGLMDFLADWTKKGITQTICTDISKDGVLKGPSVSTYKEIRQQFPGLKLVASGGVSGMDDIYVLEEADIPAVIIGKAIYEGKIQLEELQKFNY